MIRFQLNLVGIILRGNIITCRSSKLFELILNISHGFATSNLRQMRIARPQVSVVPPGALVIFYFLFFKMAAN